MGAPATLWLAVGLLQLALASCSLLEAAQTHHCAGPCPDRGAKATLDASLHGSGFHRRLLYRIAVQCTDSGEGSGDGRTAQQGAASSGVQGGGQQCVEAAVLQPLPPAVFASIYELDNAAAVGQGPRVKLFGPVDVESIERYSQATLLAVYSGSSSGGSSGSSGGSSGNLTGAVPIAGQAGGACSEAVILEVPLHARYPHPQQQSQQLSAQSAVALAQLPPPLVLARCPGDAGWQAAHTAGEAAAVSWGIPAGNLQHGLLAAVGTAAAVGCGAATVLYALLRPAGQQRRKQD